MNARLKVICGLLLLLPAFFVVFTAVVFRFDHPALTEAEIFFETGYLPYIALIACVPGMLLVRDGLEDMEDLK